MSRPEHDLVLQSNPIENQAGQWLDGTLPINVQLGRNTILKGDHSFHRFRSRLPSALLIGENCTMDGVHFALGEAAHVQIGNYCYFANSILLCEQELLIGDYVIIGREPDGGTTYAGTARVEPRTGGLFLKQHRGEHEVTAFGRLEVPSPPDEGRVLRFRWDNPEPVLTTCLVSADLDNYPRLTCTWLHEGSQPAQPGLEAMFPTTGRANEPKP